MSDWELLVPGIGLTLIGMAGVGLSLAGIAKTFLEGMHSISALVMFIGMIFIAAGLLKGGLPTTPSAKATAAIILGLMIAFGTFAASVSTVPTLPLFIGILLMIIAPSIAIAYTMNKESKYLKAVSILFISGSVTGMIVFFIFNAITAEPERVEEIPSQEQESQEDVSAILEGPRLDILIPKDSSIAGNIPYDPPDVKVSKGTILVWINVDIVAHTVTSGSGFRDPTFGKIFDSGLIDPNKQYALDTNKLEAGEYPYFCTLHPVMVGKFTVE